MQTLLAWLRSKNWTAHTVFVLAVTAAGIITGDPDVQQLLVTLLKAHPVAASNIILLACVIAKYTHSSSPAGTMATARTIQAAPNTPTTAQVNAADTKIQ